MENIINKESLEGRKFRFTISSAEEAVKTIREHLGDKARVLSVNQVDGKGFSRFLSSPKLEVIAMVPAAEPKPQVNEEIKNDTNDTVKTDKSLPEQEENTQEPAPTPKIKLSENFTNKPIGKILRKAGFSDNLLLRIENTKEWDNISQLSLSRAITEFSRWLGQEYKKIDIPELSSKVAFIGTPGSGKTMSLCKILAEHVFLHSQKAKVLKLEADTPNSNDVLGIFCETLGVDLLRDPSDLKTAAFKEKVFIDAPGITASDTEGWNSITLQLNELDVETRILVINAAYDPDLIKDILDQGIKAGATHLMFTHVDELSKKTRLWNLILQSRIPTLYFSYGQNITGDVSSNTLEYLSEQTFSSIINNLEE